MAGCVSPSGRSGRAEHHPVFERGQAPAPRLLGDRVTDALHNAGFDKLSQLYQRITGKDCGCKKRQELLNKLHAAIQRKP